MIFAVGQRGTSANRNMDNNTVNTLLLRPDNTPEDVGELTLDSVDNPSQEWPMSTDRFSIFVSHTGQDGAKEEIARPTHWLLTKKLGAEAFLDDENATPGDGTVKVLIEPAYKCSHAVVIISPSFRKRRCCVQELNTFMARRRRGDGICVIPVL